MWATIVVIDLGDQLGGSGPVNECHDKLRSRLDGDQLEPFLRHIRFPRFKNLEDKLRLDFTYPITAIVGPNGTSKTSILRAIQGCPDYYNVGSYWFSTSLDAITGESRHRFIHGYKLPTGEMVESLKTRVERKGNPDYFEPARRSASDGMDPLPPLAQTPATHQPYRKKTRWKAIEKEVVYIDFRHDIPAYDIQFHFDLNGHKNDSKSKKARIRRRSKHVAAVLDNLSASYDYYGSNRIQSAPQMLSAQLTKQVNKILGKKYTEIRLVEHNFYDHTGTTVILKTAGRSYSEAFAGSGEYAAIMLVKEIGSAAPASLVILDEPEVSLHPGAQMRLMEFLERQVLQNRHQVVISTHSPMIVEGLPPDAIKVLAYDTDTERVTLTAPASLPGEAFRSVGARSEQRIVIVEDELAGAIVTQALFRLGPGYKNVVDVRAMGSASLITTRTIPQLASLDSADLVLLDGDQRPVSPIRNEADVTDSEVLAEINKLSIGRAHLSLSGGASSNNAEALRKGRKILAWMQDHVRFLPRSTPEALLLEMLGEADGVTDAKSEWRSRTEQSFGMGDITAVDVLSVQRMALGNVATNNALMTEVMATVKSYLESSSVTT